MADPICREYAAFGSHARGSRRAQSVPTPHGPSGPGGGEVLLRSAIDRVPRSPRAADGGREHRGDDERSTRSAGICSLVEGGREPWAISRGAATGSDLM